MDGIIYTIGTRVKLHTNDAWNNLYGIVDEFVGDNIVVYCINMPSYRYFVGMDEAGKILELLS